MPGYKAFNEPNELGACFADEDPQRNVMRDDERSQRAAASA